MIKLFNPVTEWFGASSSTLVASRTLGIVWGALGWLPHNIRGHGRCPASRCQSLMTCSRPINWFSIDVSEFYVDFRENQGNSAKINENQQKSTEINKNLWKSVDRSTVCHQRDAGHRPCPLILCGNHPQSTPHYSKHPGDNPWAWGAPNRSATQLNFF